LGFEGRGVVASALARTPLRRQNSWKLLPMVRKGETDLKQLIRLVRKKSELKV
jgi:hypothetical protein